MLTRMETKSLDHDPKFPDCGPGGVRGVLSGSPGVFWVETLGKNLGNDPDDPSRQYHEIHLSH